SLLYIDVPAPWGPLAVHDVDVDLYLDRAIGAVSTLPGPGLTKFVSWPDLVVPVVEQSDQQALPSTQISLSNLDNYFYGMIGAGDYRESVVTLWQGNLTVGATPDNVTFVGAIVLYIGLISKIAATQETATIDVDPRVSQHAMTFPYLTYDPKDFKFVPRP